VNELAVPYERIDVGGEFGTNNAPEYPALNPNLLVPTMRDGELVLWESNVIVRYLSQKYGKGSLFPEKPEERWQAEQWMDWMQTRLNPHMSPILRQLVRTPPAQRDMQVVETARQVAADGWRILEDHLASRQYVAGDQFTMGDIPVGAAVYRWYAFDIERPSLPNVEAWYERLQTRPPYRTHVMLPLT
jgi:glutathione S-transferase